MSKLGPVLKTVAWSVVGVLLTLMTVHMAFNHLYGSWANTPGRIDPFWAADLMSARAQMVLPLSLTSAVITGLLMLWRPVRRGVLLLALASATVLLAAHSIYLSHLKSDDWMWRGLPAFLSTTPLILTVIWVRYRSERRSITLGIGLCAVALCSTLMAWVVPRLWLQEPVLLRTRSDRFEYTWRP
jgi:hypothetical protein